jgi:hypothetical protein
MAERTAFEDVVQRAFDANVRYWESVGRATTDYVQAVWTLWTEFPAAVAPSRARAPMNDPATDDATTSDLPHSAASA